jgi:hypothetical protein
MMMNGDDAKHEEREMSLTNYEYFENVNSMARDIFDEAVSEGNTEKDDICSYFHDTLPERVDSHSFNIYNYHHLEVLQHSENRNGFFDVMGGRIDADSVEDVFTQLAYWAFYQDIVDAFNDSVDDWMLEFPAGDEDAL